MIALTIAGILVALVAFVRERGVDPRFDEGREAYRS